MNGSYYFINSTSLKYMLTNVHTHVTRTTVMVWDISVHCKKPAVTVHAHPQPRPQAAVIGILCHGSDLIFWNCI